MYGRSRKLISTNGRIVTLANIGHQGSFVTGPAYASKGGMEGFTKYLASYLIENC